MESKWSPMESLCPHGIQLESHCNPIRTESCNQMEPTWYPTGALMGAESKWIPNASQVESQWDPNKTQVESKSNPNGTQLEPKKIPNGIEMASKRSPNDIQINTD